MQTLTGNPATPRSSPLAVSAVADGDAANAANLASTPLQPILDVIALLQAQGARKDLSNTFTQAQTLQALLTLTAAAAASLTRSGDQTVLKGGSGKLQIGTSVASDLELLVNGGVKLAVLAAGGIDAKTQKIVNVVDPASAQDAATKNYSDTGIAWTNGAAPTAQTGWTLAWSAVRRRWSGAGVALVEATIRATAGGGAGAYVAALPAGFGGPAEIYIMALNAFDATSNTPVAAYTAAAGMYLPGTITTGHSYVISGLFIAET